MTIKRPNKMVVNSLRATEREWTAWDVAARLEGLNRSEWIRHVLGNRAEVVIRHAANNQRMTERKDDDA